jgi:hypothetical protein
MDFTRAGARTADGFARHSCARMAPSSSVNAIIIGSLGAP